MKVRLVVKNPEAMTAKLKKHGIEVDQDAQFVLVEENIIIEQVMGKINDDFFPINVLDILYFESIDRFIYAHTKELTYKIKERLYELESILNNELFLRVSQGYIVNRYAILKINPMIGQKYMLHMKNNEKVTVTRNYYYKFREYFKI